MKISGVLIMAKTRKRKIVEAEITGSSVHLFGCRVCETVIFEAPEKTEIHCPVCNELLDLFVAYKNICFANAIQINLPVSAVKLVKRGKGL